MKTQNQIAIDKVVQRLVEDVKKEIEINGNPYEDFDKRVVKPTNNR